MRQLRDNSQVAALCILCVFVLLWTSILLLALQIPSRTRDEFVGVFLAAPLRAAPEASRYWVQQEIFQCNQPQWQTWHTEVIFSYFLMPFSPSKAIFGFDTGTKQFSSICFVDMGNSKNAPHHVPALILIQNFITRWCELTREISLGLLLKEWGKEHRSQHNDPVCH